MTATLTAHDLCTVDPDELLRRALADQKRRREHFPDIVLDAVRTLTGASPMPYLAPARKQMKRTLGSLPQGRVLAHRDPTADSAIRAHLTRKAWRDALAQNLPDTVPARAIDNLAILCTHQ